MYFENITRILESPTAIVDDIKHLICIENLNDVDNRKKLLQLACYHCQNVEILQYLLSDEVLGASVRTIEGLTDEKMKDKYGRTAFHSACEHQTNVEILQYLLSDEVWGPSLKSIEGLTDERMKDKNGCTAFHRACANQKDDESGVLKYLMLFFFFIDWLFEWLKFLDSDSDSFIEKLKIDFLEYHTLRYTWSMSKRMKMDKIFQDLFRFIFDTEVYKGIAGRHTNKKSFVNEMLNDFNSMMTREEASRIKLLFYNATVQYFKTFNNFGPEYLKIEYELYEKIDHDFAAAIGKMCQTSTLDDHDIALLQKIQREARLNMADILQSTDASTEEKFYAYCYAEEYNLAIKHVLEDLYDPIIDENGEFSKTLWNLVSDYKIKTTHLQSQDCDDSIEDKFQDYSDGKKYNLAVKYALGNDFIDENSVLHDDFPETLWNLISNYKNKGENITNKSNIPGSKKRKRQEKR